LDEHMSNSSLKTILPVWSSRYIPPAAMAPGRLVGVDELRFRAAHKTLRSVDRQVGERLTASNWTLARA
jgi:hypothetical protein